MDGFAWLFAALVTGIGFLVVLYARYYMSPEDPVPRFFAFLLAFMGAMMGVVLSGNLIQLVFFWELTSLFSFLLIGYWHHTAAARDGARMALTVTAIGGLCLLAGVLLLGHIVGSYDLDRVLAAGDLIRVASALPAGAGPDPARRADQERAVPLPLLAAARHGGADAGLGLSAFGDAGEGRRLPAGAAVAGAGRAPTTWFWIVGSAGLVTLLLGAYIAIFQHDLKGLLAYSTISHLGLITLLLGLNSPLALVAAIFHIMNHATFKASLFMAAGIIDHETGTRDIRRLSGLNRFMPFTATLAMVAAAAMAGVPLLNGFLSKEMFFAEALSAHASLTLLLDHRCPIAAMLASAFSVAYSLRFIHGAFFGPDAGRPAAHAARAAAPGCGCRSRSWCSACIVVGVAAGGHRRALPGHRPSRSVLGAATPEYSLAVWHGFNLPLLMSVIALAAASCSTWLLQRHLRQRRRRARRCSAGSKGQRIFERAMVFLSWRCAPHAGAAARHPPAAAAAAADRLRRLPGRGAGAAALRAAARAGVTCSPATSTRCSR